MKLACATPSVLLVIGHDERRRTLDFLPDRHGRIGRRRRGPRPDKWSDRRSHPAVAGRLDARHIASGRAVSLDDPALLQRPQAHEVTLTVDGRFLVFRPLSRASLDPFLGR